MRITRYQFLKWHLFISICISIVALLWVFNIWYPSPLAKATDVLYIFLMLLGIDVILGPLLGFIVYREKKKTLKFDLAIIFLFQCAALIYGLYSISQARPAWIVYNVDRFELVRKNEIIQNHISQAKQQFQSPSWLKPQFVAVKFASNSEERNQNMFEEVFAGISLAQRPERYVNFAQAKVQIKQRAKNLEELKDYNNEKSVMDALAKYPKANAFLPLKANEIDMTVLVNKNTGEVVKIVDLRPWK
ncbi:type IV pilin accessory protein [Acinetobacter sp. YH16040_T]|uniref:TfpX/TfpZ family type IV pilin accessory protein n=1 Tax=unclassified Acinetobacter TaxID=196816 RepID=UPI0015D0E43F|nr:MULTISPECIES: TfpX/TfpZ family type IV pilin accessory protein [unclassified Acinetobacter]UUS57325.1 type IV pilin accessory protein [Acinetobacter sp. YH16040_T]